MVDFFISLIPYPEWAFLLNSDAKPVKKIDFNLKNKKISKWEKHDNQAKCTIAADSFCIFSLYSHHVVTN